MGNLKWESGVYIVLGLGWNARVIDVVGILECEDVQPKTDRKIKETG